MYLNLEFVPDIIVYYYAPHEKYPDNLIVGYAWGNKDVLSVCGEYLMSLVKGRTNCFLAVKSNTLKYQIIEGKICKELK